LKLTESLPERLAHDGHTVINMPLDPSPPRLVRRQIARTVVVIGDRIFLVDDEGIVAGLEDQIGTGIAGVNRGLRWAAFARRARDRARISRCCSGV
jgi:hypothetical protein